MENEANEATSEQEQEQAGESTAQEGKTYTESEVKDLLQRESDKRVTEALKKADKKKEAAVKEAQRLAQMNDDQKHEYELKQREEVIAAKEHELALAQNMAQASAILAERHISTSIVDMVVAEDADEMLEKINKLDAAFKKSVKEEVERRLSTTTPKKNLPLESAVTKEQFRKMPLTQQAELSKQNPELYKQLIQK